MFTPKTCTWFQRRPWLHLPPIAALVVLLVLPTTGAASTAPLCSAPRLARAITSPTGLAVAGNVATGDLNTDGRNDVVVLGGSTPGTFNQVSILLGRGDGTFLPPVLYTVGEQPGDVAVGDLNGDGHPDIVVADQAGFVWALIGNGDGTFRTPVASPTLANGAFASLALVDLNRDGRLDAVFADQGVVSILEGKGDGDFEPPATYLVDFPYNSIGVGDFNLDHILDLAVTNAKVDTVSVLLGRGDASFQTAVSYPVPGGPLYIAVGDLRGAGRLDLVMSSAASLGPALMFGNGDGTFQAPLRLGAGAEPGAGPIVLSDFNKDGSLDIATISDDAQFAHILIGHGNGTFEAARSFGIPGGAAALQIGDLNHDGLPDLIAPVSGGSLVVLLNVCGKGSLELNGVSAFAATANTQGFITSGDWTVETWFKDEDPAGFDHDYVSILNKGDRQSDAESPYFVTLGHKLLLVGERSAWTDYALALDLHRAGVDPSSWHHVAVTFEAHSRTITLYFDGTRIRQEQLAVTSKGNSLPLQVGRNGQGAGKYFKGKLQDMRIWSIVRTSAQVAENYKTQLIGTQPGLVANWNFNDAAGSVARDSSGNHHDLDLNGGAAFGTDVHP